MIKTIYIILHFQCGVAHIYLYIYIRAEGSLEFYDRNTCMQVNNIVLLWSFNEIVKES